ncbi:receptor-type tyrosine-protein phosphatase O isoform X1 [Anas platyrhynchos]|uniref:receptor-type tyrosine-protein phosphatase O isoform X1 n=1 Tax=Anas platyrhynchos TaxID=8839 RepID=UPI000F7CEBEB|nr:receptor-type tyrosine-protein phosphatase O isoform X1 [Anas platyrhynchos]|eukprot:XP_027317673.1 receptor-type tyrosine-protein phosphatase O isoform X1 [Anas platyrhynchos]
MLPQFAIAGHGSEPGRGSRGTEAGGRGAEEQQPPPAGRPPMPGRRRRGAQGGPGARSCLLWLFVLLKNAEPFQVTVREDNCIIVSLEASDVVSSSSVYVVKIAGESKNYFFQFEEFNSTLPAPVVFNAKYHGLYYIVTLLVVNSNMVSKSARSITVLTKPLPVSSVSIYDYKPSPETGVLFEIQYPEKYNVFTRVNISYWEGKDYRTMLYKDFFKGKTVFNHWLPGICYSNITFQLVSEATFNKSTLVEYSGVRHEPKQHRTVPYPPRNISVQIVPINRNNWEEHSGNFPEEPFMGPQKIIGKEKLSRFSGEPPVIPAVNTSAAWPDYRSNSTEYEATSQPYWWPNEAESSEGEEEFVNAVPSDYEANEVNTSGKLTPEPAPFLPVQMVLTWLPPKPPTAFDGFHINIEREENSTEFLTVSEDTHKFVAELKEPGKYKLSVTTFSSSGSCEVRESQSPKTLSFYISPTGEWIEELTEKPQHVTVTVLSSTTALTSWTASQESGGNSTIVSVVSLTCQKQKESQRLEKHYCTEVNSSNSLIENLVPGAQYQVVVYLRKGPLVGPPSDPVTFSIVPTGIKDLTLYPLGPTAVVLSWNRPFLGVFRKYVVEMFYFNPSTMTSEWTTYYEIAATISLTASVRIANLLPAWYYNFRVTMVTWGDPELSCCDSSTISFITAPVAPEITSIEYYNHLLYVTWTYGEDGTDLSHSRMLHWMVIAEGKKKIKKSVTRSVMTAVLSLPPGDIYNLSVTACTERGSNSSLPQLVKLEPAPPKSLFAVNKTQTSVTLLWVEEGVADFFEVYCQQAGSVQETKLQEPVTVSSHVVTISSLTPATSYNCSVTTFSHNSPSVPTFIAVSTMVTEMNPNIVVISVLAILSILLIGLLLVTLVVLRRKHLQMARECGAGTFVNFASLERDGKLPYNWRRSVFAFLTLLPSCLWTDYLLAFYINPWSKNGLKKRKLTNPVQLDDFDGYIKDMAKDSDYKFSLQFEELKLIGLDIPHFAADLPMNRCKNRYTNILPYDFSRVRLVSMNEEEGSDYINANYIPGYNSPQEYIATQGPLPETRNDFWKMVLQQKSQIIVMLTQCNEKRRVKCDHYWPFTEDPIAYGDITVEMLSEEEHTDWVYRNFRICYADEVQDVMHFNYTAWPDHGVPTTNAAESILQFVQMVRQKSAKSKGPMIIHCSAGVGRTGTFIALDRLLQHIRDHEFVDILGLVSDMRSYRMSMVQTEEQYIFIHQCVQLMWQKKKQQFCISDVIYENVSKS